MVDIVQPDALIPPIRKKIERHIVEARNDVTLIIRKLKQENNKSMTPKNYLKNPNYKNTGLL